MHNRIINKTRYDNSGKPMKKTSFTIEKKKNWRETFLKSNPL